MKIQTINHKLCVALAALTIASATQSFAQSGVWTVNNFGNWSDIANWNAGVGPIASGAGNTADFSTIDITAARTVTLDANFTIGSLLFSDKTPFFAWTLASTGGSVLTLDNGGSSPVIAVTNQTTVIGAGLAGTAGFTKVGPAQLTLSGTNTFTGGIIVNGGTVLINAIAPFGGGGVTNLTLIPQDLTVRGATVNLNDAATAGTTSQGFVNLTVGAGQSFLGQSRGSGAKGFYVISGIINRNIGGTVDVPNNDASRTQTFVTNSAVASGNILANGVSFLTGNGFVDWYAKAAASPFALAPATYTASTATTLAGNANVAVATTTLAANTSITSLRDAAVQVSTINLGGFNLTNGGTLMSAAVTAGNGLVITNGTLLPPPNQDVVIVQNGAGSVTVAAIIADNGTAAALTKSAAGVLILSSNNTYSGTTYINAGTVQVGNGGTSGNLGSSALVQGQAGTLVFNRSDNISFAGSIIGPVALTKLGGGTLTLSGDGAFSGSTTISAGILQLGNGGVTGSISNSLNIANSGTLVFNTSSPKTYAGSITLNGPVVNQGSGAITLLTGLNGTGAAITNSGAGSLVLNAVNTYGGNTTISGGSLVLGANAAISNSPVINIGSGAKLDVSTLAFGLALNGAGPVNQTLVGFGVVTGSVAVASGSSVNPGGSSSIGTLSFSNNLTLAGGTLAMETSTNVSLRDKVIVGGTLTLGSGSIQISVVGAPLTNGYYPLIIYPAGSLVGSVANLSVSGFSQAGQIADLDDSIPGQIRLFVLSATPNNLVWQGGFSSDWDTIGSPNWFSGVYAQHDNARFDDSAVNFNVNLAGVLKPNLVVVSNLVNNYTFASSSAGNRITGSAALEKDGAATLVLNAVNDYTGTTTIKAGALQVGDGANTGNIGSGNTVNNSILDFNLPDTQIVSSAISGTGRVVSDGASGTVILTGNNSYGATIINGGVLQVGIGSGTGSLGTGPVTNNATLNINRSGTLNVNNGITGTGTLIKSGAGTLVLGGFNDYVGNTSVANGVLKLAASQVIPNGGATTGWLILDGGSTLAGAVDLNGFNQTVNALSGLGNTVNGLITNSAASATTTNKITVGTTGTANTFAGIIADGAASAKISLVVLGTGSLRLNGASTFSGGTFVGDTATLIFPPGALIGNNGSITLSNATTFNIVNNGGTGSFPGNTLVFPDGAAATVNSTQLGNGFGGLVVGGNTATNIITGQVSCGTAAVKQFQSMTGVVQVATGAQLRFSSTGLNVNGSDNALFEIIGQISTRNGTGGGAGVSLGAISGAGTLSGAVSADGNGAYVIGAKGIDTVFSGTISGTAPRGTSIVKTGAGRLTLDGTLSYDGVTTINGGILTIGSVANPATTLDASAGVTLASPGILDVSAITGSTLNLGNSIIQTLAGNGTIRGSLSEAATTINNLTLGVMAVTNVAAVNGALNMQINRTNTPNCSQLSALSFVNGGAIVLTVANVGSTNLASGDTFQLFNQAFTGGFVATNLPALPSAQLYWTNKIAINGTIAIASTVNTAPTNITSSVSGNVLTLSWPADHIGWRLQSQTNTLGVGLNPISWTAIPGSASVNTLSFTIDPASPTVFYRMVYP